MKFRQTRPIPAPAKAGAHGQAFLLYQDFHNRLMPTRSRMPGAYRLSSEGEPPQRIINSLSLRPEYRPQLDHFLRDVALKLFTHFEVWIEVGFPDDDGPTPFAVYDADGIQRTGSGGLIQALPSMPTADEAPEWMRGMGEWDTNIELDEERMVHVTMPEEYPEKVFSKVVTDLSEVASNVARPWVLEELSSQKPGGPLFDIGEADRTERLRILQSTLPIGWAAREGILGEQSRISHYYDLWRQMRFLHFRASMRQRAEQALRDVLTIASERCGFSVQVSAHGVYTPEHVQTIIKQFEAGKVDLEAAWDIVNEREEGGYSDQRRIA